MRKTTKRRRKSDDIPLNGAFRSEEKAPFKENKAIKSGSARDEKISLKWYSLRNWRPS